MKLSGTQIIERSPQEFWKLIMDPEVLKECMPGCEELESIGENKFRVALKVGIGPVKGRFRGTVDILDVVEQESYRLLIKAKGSTGYINGSSSLRLLTRNSGQSTELTYESEAQVGGVLASIGARLFESVGRQYAEQFFKNLAKLDSGGQE